MAGLAKKLALYTLSTESPTSFAKAGILVPKPFLKIPFSNKFQYKLNGFGTHLDCESKQAGALWDRE